MAQKEMAVEVVGHLEERVRDIVKPIADIGEKLESTGGFFTGDLWHYLLTLLLVLLVTYWTRKFHAPIGDFVQKKLKDFLPKKSARFIINSGYTAIVIFALPIAYMLSIITKKFTSTIFDLNFVIIIFTFTQVLFWIYDKIFHKKGAKSDRLRILYMAQVLKAITVVFAGILIFIIFNIRVSEVIDQTWIAWVIPIVSMTVIVPFVKDSLISARQFIKTFENLRIGDSVVLDDRAYTFQDITGYSVVFGDSEGNEITMPFTEIIKKTAKNNSGKHSWKISKKLYFGTDIPSLKLKEVDDSLQQIIFSNEREHYYGYTDINNVDGKIELLFVYYIRIEEECRGRICAEHLALRQKINLAFLERLKALNVSLWQQPRLEMSDLRGIVKEV